MRYIRSICRLRFRKKTSATLLVCVLWASGLCLGRYCAAFAGTDSFSLVRLSATVMPYFALQLIGQLLPLALTYLAVRYRITKALVAIIFMDAFCFGFAAFLSVTAFRSAGWLVYRIQFFSECINTFFLLWVWVNTLGDRRYLTCRKFGLFSGIICLVTIFDYFVCSGFLKSVLT